MQRLPTIASMIAGLIGLGSDQLAAAGPDHLDGIPDDTVLFIPGPHQHGVWGLSHTRMPPDSFYSGDWLSGGFVGFNEGYLTPDPNRTFVADIDGDGVDDLVVEGFYSGWTEFFVGKATPSDQGLGYLGDSPSRWRGVYAPAYDFFVADVNGDGRADLITVSDDNNNMRWEATYLPLDPDPTGTDNSWDLATSSNVTYGEVRYPAGGGTREAAGRALVGDFNGDGRTDVGRRLPSDADNAGGYILMILSGLDGLDAPGLGIEDVVQGSVSNFADDLGVPANVATLVGDVNGDGKDDIVEVEDRAHNSSFLFVAGLTGVCGDASGLCIAPGGISWAAPFGDPPADTTLNIPLLADFNGDGRDDLVVYRELRVRNEDGSINPDLMNGQWLVSFTQESGNLFDSLAPEVGQFWFPADWAPLRPMVGQFRTCLTVPCCPEPFADADRDHDVDQSDFALFQECITGPAGGVSLPCRCFDRENAGEGDGRIDSADLAAFLDCVSGPAVPADPACGL